MQPYGEYSGASLQHVYFAHEKKFQLLFTLMFVHLFRQVCLADLLILNKTDMSSEESLKTTRDVIRCVFYY